MGEDSDVIKRRWAMAKLSGFRSELEGLDERREEVLGKIQDYESFLRVLSVSESEIKARPSSPIEFPPEGSLGELIVQVLSRVNGEGLPARDIMNGALKMGYSPTPGKSSVYNRVSSELYRLSKERKYGVVQVNKGRFALKRGE